jgi:hypothetical protein
MSNDENPLLAGSSPAKRTMIFHRSDMKKLSLLLLLVLALCPGCATRYSIALTDGSTYVSHGRPHYDKDTQRWSFTDSATGQKLVVSRLNIREIAPYSMRSADNSTFLPQGTH